MMDLWIIEHIAPIFYTLLELSLAAVCIGLGVLLLRKLLDKKIPPIWKNALWLLMLVALVVPYRPSSNVAVVPSVQVDFAAQKEVAMEQVLFYGVHSRYLTQAEQQEINELTVQAVILDGKSQVFEVALPLLWLVGMGVMVAILALTHLRLRRRVTACRDRHPDEHLQTLMERTRQAMSLRQEIQICYQDYLKSPALYGLFRPTILLPDYTEELSEDSLRYILLHELSHLKHHDLWKNTALLTLQVVYWFNPLIWVLFRFIRQDMELLNDSRVLKVLEKEEETAYAMSLIEVLGHSNKLPLAPQMLCMVDNKDNTKRRIQMIQLGEVFKKHKIIISVGCLAVIGVLSVLFLTSPASPLEWAHTLDKDDIEKVELYWMEIGEEDAMYLLDENQCATLCIMLNNCNGEETDDTDPGTGIQVQYSIYLTDGTVQTISLHPSDGDTYFFRMGKTAFWGDRDQMNDWMRLTEDVTTKSAVAQPETPTIEMNENDTLRELLAQAETPPTTTPDPDPWGITLTASDVTPAGMTLVCTQSGGGEYYTGEVFAIERLENGTWTALPVTSDIWNDIAWIIASDGTSPWEVDWSSLYGTLELGTYRLSKEIYSGKDATNNVTYYAEFEVMEDYSPILSPTRSHEQLYENLNLDGIGEDDDTVYAYVASWDEYGQTDCIVVAITFGTGDTASYVIPPAGYSYGWGYSLYTGNLFSEDREDIILEVLCTYSNYGGADVYVLDVYGASETDPPTIVERLNTEANTMRLPSGMEVSLDELELVSVKSFTDGTQVVDIPGATLQGLTLYATGSNGDYREVATTICWTDAGWEAVSSIH